MLTLFALASLQSAHAQVAGDWSELGTTLLDATDIPWGGLTIGSPTVVFDSNFNGGAGRYIMLFESMQVAPAPAGPGACTAGEWAIGLATSTDGLNWSVTPSPLIDPNPLSATYYSCVAAHPGAIYTGPQVGAPGGTVTVYFKGEQPAAAPPSCAVSPASWGCTQYTGIGGMRIRFNANGTVKDQVISPAPLLVQNTNFGYPKPMKYGTKNMVSFTKYPDVHLAQLNVAGNVLTDKGVALSVSAITAPWVVDEFYNAALACRDPSVPANPTPMEFFAGSRDTQGAVVLTGAVGKAVASPSNPLGWIVDYDAQFAFSGDLDYRHWDVLRIADAEYLMYYDKRVGGVNEIHLASTRPSFTWTNAEVYDKACP